MRGLWLRLWSLLGGCDAVETGAQEYGIISGEWNERNQIWRNAHQGLPVCWLAGGKEGCWHPRIGLHLPTKWVDNIWRLFGIVNYKIDCNFTNYGSALLSWVLDNWRGKEKWWTKISDYRNGRVAMKTYRFSFAGLNFLYACVLHARLIWRCSKNNKWTLKFDFA